MYIMESGREAQRLDAKTDLEQIRQRLKLVELAPGMCVLDAGAGSGAIARVMCDMVSPAGAVIALERSSQRIDFMSSKLSEERLRNLHPVQADLFSPPLKAESFDLVWCEFVFEYLTEPDRAARVLAELVRPGGKLVIADLDGNGMFHYPLPDEIAAGMQAVFGALEPDFDPFAGRKLYYWLRKAALDEIRVHMLPYHFYVGEAGAADIERWRIKFDTIRARAAAALGGFDRYDRWVASYLDMLRDPDTFTYSALFIVEGRKPKR